MTRLVAIGLVVGVATFAAWLSRRGSAPVAVGVAELEKTEGEAPTPLAAKPSIDDGDVVPATVPTGSTTPASAAEEASRRSAPFLVRVVAGDRFVDGATVSLASWHGEDPPVVRTTDARGSADFGSALRSLFGHAALVRAVAPGFRTASMTISKAELDLDADGAMRIELSTGVSFTGRVVDAATGLGVAGAVVVVHDTTWRPMELPPTGADGRFDVPGVRDDAETTIAAEASGYASTTLPVRVDSGRAHPSVVVVRMERARTIVGAVKGADGMPVAGATVRVRRAKVERASADGDRRRTAEAIRPEEALDGRVGTERDGDVHTSDEGRFRVDGLVAATFELVASAPGHAASTPVRARSEEDAGHDVELVLRRPATVWVRIRVPAGTTLPEGASVVLYGEDSAFHPDGNDGRVRFGDVPPGRYLAWATAPGLRAAAKEIHVAEGATMDVDLDLDAGAVVQGIVVGEDGAPIAGARVDAAAAQAYDGTDVLPYAETAESNAGGRFSIGGLPHGDVVVVARPAQRETRRPMGTRQPVRVRAPARDVRVVIAGRAGVRVRLVTADGGPFSGEVAAEVAPVRHERRPLRSRVTRDGVLEEEGLIDGEYRIVVAPHGHAWFSRTFSVDDGASVEVGDVVVGPGVEVSGRVVDRKGRGLAGVRVASEENGDRETRTEPDGRFRFVRFPAERVVLAFSAAGCVDRRVEVDPSRTTGLEVEMSPAR